MTGVKGLLPPAEESRLARAEPQPPRRGRARGQGRPRDAGRAPGEAARRGRAGRQTERGAFRAASSSARVM